jgi:hypothetical protein
MKCSIDHNCSCDPVSQTFEATALGETIDTTSACHKGEAELGLYRKTGNGALRPPTQHPAKTGEGTRDLDSGINQMNEFIDEDDLKTFEGWLRYQAVDASMMTKEELDWWHRSFEEAQKERATRPMVGLMNLKSVEGEYKYAVAVREGTDLWLVLWVRRNRKGEYFVLKPMADKDWNPHSSYHLDGTRHHKSFGQKILLPQKGQPLSGSFRGTMEFPIQGGFSPKGTGAICDPAAFSGVVEVAPGILGPRHGCVGVFLVEPGIDPPDYTKLYEVVTQRVFRDVSPHVVVAVMREKPAK